MSIYSNQMGTDAFYVASELAPRFTEVPGEVLHDIIAEAVALGVLVSADTVEERIENAVYDAEEKAEDIGRAEGYDEASEEWADMLTDIAEASSTLLDDLVALVPEDNAEDRDEAQKLADEIIKMLERRSVASS